MRSRSDFTALNLTNCRNVRARLPAPAPSIRSTNDSRRARCRGRKSRGENCLLASNEADSRARTRATACCETRVRIVGLRHRQAHARRGGIASRRSDDEATEGFLELPPTLPTVFEEREPEWIGKRIGAFQIGASWHPAAWGMYFSHRAKMAVLAETLVVKVVRGGGDIRHAAPPLRSGASNPCRASSSWHCAVGGRRRSGQSPFHAS